MPARCQRGWLRMATFQDQPGTGIRAARYRTQQSWVVKVPSARGGRWSRVQVHQILDRGARAGLRRTVSTLIAPLLSNEVALREELAKSAWSKLVAAVAAADRPAEIPLTFRRSPTCASWCTSGCRPNTAPSRLGARSRLSRPPPRRAASSRRRRHRAPPCAVDGRHPMPELNGHGPDT